MYDAWLLLPFSQGFSPEAAAPPEPYQWQQDLRLPLLDEELMRCLNAVLPEEAPHMGNLVPTSTISEYDLGGGDLFSAPEPIIEEPVIGLDPVSAAMSIISGGDVMEETIKVAGMESIQEDSLLSDVFYECKKDLLANSAFEGPFSELSDIKDPAMQMEEVPVEQKLRLYAEGPIQRSISTGCLHSVDWINGCAMRPNFLDFQGLDFEAAFGIRRSFSEGDIQALGNSNANIGNTNTVQSSNERLSTITDMKAEERKEKLSRYRKKKTKRNFGRKIKALGNSNANIGNTNTVQSSNERLSTITDMKAEERKEKLSRYRKKKTKRNFGRKIKYACRKALADSQPRVRGRFARTEDSEISKLQ